MRRRHFFSSPLASVHVPAALQDVRTRSLVEAVEEGRDALWLLFARVLQPLLALLCFPSTQEDGTNRSAADTARDQCASPFFSSPRLIFQRNRFLTALLFDAQPWKKSPCRINFNLLPSRPLTVIHPFSCWEEDGDGGLHFKRSTAEFSQYATIGDAILDKLVPEVLIERYKLLRFHVVRSPLFSFLPHFSLTPFAVQKIAAFLVRNAVLARLAEAYKLHTARRPGGECGQHLAGDLFEAFVATVEPGLLKPWISEVFRRLVFPCIKQKLREFRAKGTFLPLPFPFPAQSVDSTSSIFHETISEVSLTQVLPLSHAEKLNKKRTKPYIEIKSYKSLLKRPLSNSSRGLLDCHRRAGTIYD